MLEHSKSISIAHQKAFFHVKVYRDGEISAQLLCCCVVFILLHQQHIYMKDRKHKHSGRGRPLHHHKKILFVSFQVVKNMVHFEDGSEDGGDVAQW